MKKTHFKIGVYAVFVIVIAVSVVCLAGCFPTGLSEGINEDPRSFKDYKEYVAYIYKADTEMPFRFFEPELSEGESAPLLIFLHGSGECGNDNKRQIMGIIAQQLASFGDERPCFVMMPQLPKNIGWNDMESTLIAAVDYVTQNYAVDVDRLYITGLSLGGGGTFSAVYNNPQKFAAAAIVCGYPNEGEIDYSKFSDTPLWIAHGKDDTIVDYSNFGEMLEGLNAVGITPKYTEYLGLQHNIWNAFYADSAFYDWLFAQRRG